MLCVCHKLKIKLQKKKKSCAYKLYLLVLWKNVTKQNENVTKQMDENSFPSASLAQ